MKLILSIVFHCFLIIKLVAQTSSPALFIQEVNFEDKTRVENAISKQLKKRLAKNFQHQYSAYIRLKMNITLGKMHTINGMDTYTVSDAEITYTVGDKDFLKTEQLSLPIKVKGTNERELIQKVGTSIIRDREHCDKLINFVQTFINETLGDCNSLEQLVTATIKKGEQAEAYSLLGYFGTDEMCQAKRLAMEEQLINKHKTIICDETISKATILANSADEQKMSRAINMLLRIPPDAPCIDDALKISEKIGDNTKTISQHKAAKIQERIVVQKEMTSESWRNWYLNSYYKNYRRNIN